MLGEGLPPSLVRSPPGRTDQWAKVGRFLSRLIGPPLCRRHVFSSRGLSVLPVLLPWQACECRKLGKMCGGGLCLLGSIKMVCRCWFRFASRGVSRRLFGGVNGCRLAPILDHEYILDVFYVSDRKYFLSNTRKTFTSGGGSSELPCWPDMR